MTPNRAQRQSLLEQPLLLLPSPSLLCPPRPSPPKLLAPAATCPATAQLLLRQSHELLPRSTNCHPKNIHLFLPLLRARKIFVLRSRLRGGSTPRCPEEESSQQTDSGKSDLTGCKRDTLRGVVPSESQVNTPSSLHILESINTGSFGRHCLSSQD